MKKGSTKIKSKRIIIAIAILAIVGFGIWYFMDTMMTGGIDKNAKEYEVNVERPKDWDSDRIAVPGYGEIYMKAGSDDMNIALFNPDGNPCYFTFTIILDKGEETLFKSKLVPPGQAVTNVKLSKKMKAGKYPMTIKIDAVSLKDKKAEMNGSEVKTQIIAE